jgi:hypothetical protein
LTKGIKNKAQAKSLAWVDCDDVKLNIAAIK